MNLSRRGLLVGGGALAALVGCRAGALPRPGEGLRALEVAVDVPHGAVIYVAGQPMLVDPLAGPAQENLQIAAGVAALNLQERARALCPAARFGDALRGAAVAALPTIGLAPAAPGAPADARLAVRVDKFGIRAALLDGPARYSVEVRAQVTRAGGGRPLWRGRRELAGDLTSLGPDAPASVAAIGRIPDPEVTRWMEAIARTAGEGVIAALGRELAE